MGTKHIKTFSITVNKSHYVAVMSPLSVQLKRRTVIGVCVCVCVRIVSRAIKHTWIVKTPTLVAQNTLNSSRKQYLYLCVADPAHGDLDGFQGRTVNAPTGCGGGVA